ncbi:MAG: MFS transporter [Candidatus Binatus sp.]|uniref:MFS transporter n=1 Tax=Candidatus Binatus sp. TaxID=2811406 RepID=UPI00271DE042|nr:MFS transporter [Candidatus Binatus sp.]MDO8433925.1 MFS transporter [Candidatus Binatus sp.]
MRPRALQLLRRKDFRRLYFAISISELGDSFHYIALMWMALVTGGPLGVIAVRLADSIPALVFGLHGGVAADRWNRRNLMIAADLARGAILVPVAIAGLSNRLPIWGLVVAAFLLETATSYFAPAYNAMVPSLVDRENVQEANSLVSATTSALSIGGWAAAAGLLAIAPISTFFALNSLSFFLSAMLIGRIGYRDSIGISRSAERPRIREVFTALRPMPSLATAVIMIGLGVTISAGTWIAGVPELVRTVLHREAGGFSIVMVGYALGSVGGGALLARYPVANKTRMSMLAWILYLPAYGLFAFSSTLIPVVVGACLAGMGQSAALILVTASAQEQIGDDLLGRVMGVITLVYRGAHATGLMFVAPLFAVFAPRAIFAGAAFAIPILGIASAISASLAEKRRRVASAAST